MFRKVMFNLRFLFVLLFCTTLFFTAFSQQKIKKILVIHSYHIGYSWNDSLSSGLLKTLYKADNVDVFVEFLDGKRYENSAHFEKLFHIYQYKYKPGFFDIVILSDNLALEFALQYGDKLFGNTPVVFCGVNNPYHYKYEQKPYYCLLQTQEDGAVLWQINRLMPQLKNLYLISDNTETGKDDMARIKQLTKHMPTSIHYHFIDDCDVDSLFDQVKSMNQDDAIFLISLQRDKYGTPLNYSRIVTKLCDISPVPIFSSNYSNLGKGIVGGCFANAVTQGELSAKIALNILFTPGYVPAKMTIPTPEYYFDYAALQRFSIAKELLPVNAKFINQPEDVYTKYKKQILSTLSFIVFLVVVIFILFKNIQRRKKAEKIVAKQYEEIQQHNKDILLANQNLNETNAELEITNETLSVVNEQLVKAKEHAEKSDKLKTAFLQNMSHEIRTPMHAIMGFSNLLINFYNNKSELETYTGYINKYCNDLLAIISDILDIAKIESGQLTVVKEQCDVNELFAELKAMFSEHQKQINKEHVSLIMRCDTDICMFTDRLKLKQILINLINNAFKFTDEGSVEVGCKVEENDQICFYVKDSGIGISAENQLIIFERFAQLENPSTRSYGGNGLGLSIVKGLVCLLGGEINIASELGKGSTFYLKIPAL